MRTTMRLLLVGVLLCIGLQVGELQPVYADDEVWQPGEYEGFVMITAQHSVKGKGSGNGSSHSYELNVTWRMGRVLDLKLIANETALLTVRGNKLFTAIEQSGKSTFSASGKNCTWSERITGEGVFTALPPLSGASDNFDAGYFKLPLTWNEQTTWKSFQGETQGNAPNCNSHWDDALAEIQEKEAIDKLSRQINQLSFLTTLYGPNIIGGACFLPTWEKGYPKRSTEGIVEHIIKDCRWRVFKPGTKEWKGWLDGEGVERETK